MRTNLDQEFLSLYFCLRNDLLDVKQKITFSFLEHLKASAGTVKLGVGLTNGLDKHEGTSLRALDVGMAVVTCPRTNAGETALRGLQEMLLKYKHNPENKPFHRCGDRGSERLDARAVRHGAGAVLMHVVLFLCCDHKNSPGERGHVQVHIHTLTPGCSFPESPTC